MKYCNHPNCKNPVFSHQKCKYHYRYIPKKKKLVRLTKRESQVELFRRVWYTRGPYSELSGESLLKYQNSFWLNLFMHILSKKQFPKFKYLDENIMLGTPEEHYLIDFGTKEQRNKYNEGRVSKVNWDKFYEKQEELKEKYNQNCNE